MRHIIPDAQDHNHPGDAEWEGCPVCYRNLKRRVLTFLKAWDGPNLLECESAIDALREAVGDK